MGEHTEVPDSTLFGFSWFVFEIVIKALSLKLQASGGLNGTQLICNFIVNLLVEYRSYWTQHVARR